MPVIRIHAILPSIIYLFLLAVMYKLNAAYVWNYSCGLSGSYPVQDQIYTYVTDRIQSDFKAGASQFYLLAKCFIKK